MNFDKLPFNWFDIALLIVLIVGLRRGRKNGLSLELIGMFQWLILLFGCAFAYGPVSEFVTSSSTVFSVFSANLMAYIAVALIILGLFAFLRKSAGGKLIGSDVFGSGEFYLGMMACMIKFTCITFVLLAFLNARLFGAAEVKAELKYQNEVYGSDFFPSLHAVQSQVFEKSFIGPCIKNQLGWLLIKPTVPEQTQLARKEFSVP